MELISDGTFKAERILYLNRAKFSQRLCLLTVIVNIFEMTLQWQRPGAASA